jgi:hypothetical protein
VNAGRVDNLPNHRFRVEIDNDDLGGMGNVETPGRDVYRQIVPASFTGDGDVLLE